MRKIRYSGFILAVLSIATAAFGVMQADETDPVLSYYCERARQAYESVDPIESGLNFSFRAKTYYMDIGEHGEVIRLDSGITDYYYSFGQLDSSEVILKPEQSHRAVELLPTNVFADNYEFFFYPNDTGGVDLAIGFDTHDSLDTLPVGLTVIDRDKFVLRWLYLHFPQKKYYKRFSQSFRFVDQEGYIFPDSAWQVSARRGVFTDEFFRYETGISDITIYR